MNYTPLDEAYKIHHINSNTYGGNIKYHPRCIYCSHPESTPLILKGDGDGGAFRRCNRCKKNFTATSINNAVNNFSFSTHHLKGTN